LLYSFDVNGLLAKEMPSSVIAAANSRIAKVMEIRQQKQESGKPLRLGKSLLHRMGYVKRIVSTSAEVPPKDFDALKAQFVYDADVLVDYGDIPDALVINWDHTGIKEGQKCIQITGIDDKRQITTVFAATKTGSFLPIQS